MAEYCNDGVILAQVMLEHLNEWPDKPAEILLGDLEKRPPSMMLQELAAAEVRRRYVNRSYIGVWPFAVYIRIEAKDTNARFQATGALHALNDWLNEKDDAGNYWHLPMIDRHRTATSITMTMLPAIAERFEKGIEDYQALFELEYKYTERRN